ncbi:Clp protease N-terminal domain-containing protein [Nocardia sp. NPDC051463]|uniref:Clp protease N-terminal domain-containing protein n=1 Tax=Nocardia sp. NPDC051463 TaxID=3154845 RepID=UPI00344E1F49
MTELPLTPRLVRLLAAAEDIARQRGKEIVGVDHLQLAILADADAVPTQVMARLGWEPAELTTALEALIGTPSYSDPPYRAKRLDGRVFTGDARAS